MNCRYFRGVSEAYYVQDLNRYVFLLTIFSNSNQEKLSFRFKSLNNEFENLLSDEFAFTNDAIYGQAMKPFPLHLTSSTEIIENENSVSIFVYPNPVTDKLQIKSDDQIYAVTLSGLSGNCILSLGNISEYTLLIDTENLVSGMYILKIETSKGIIIRKLIKSSS